MGKLQQGIIPQEYKEVTEKGKKSFSSKQAFIQDKRLEQEYKNRSYASLDRMADSSSGFADGRPRTGHKNNLEQKRP